MPILVENFEGLTRYHVTGSKGDIYLTDISCYWGSGKCNCQDFEIRREPILKLGKAEAMKQAGSEIWPNPKYHCKHLEATFRKIGHELAIQLAVSESRKPKSHDEM